MTLIMITEWLQRMNAEVYESLKVILSEVEKYYTNNAWKY